MKNISISFLTTLLAYSVVGSAQPVTPPAQPTDTPPKTSLLEEWKPKLLEWNGDLRYRMVNQKEGSDNSRHYHQLRARLGLRAEVNDFSQAVIRMATATSSVSANQTLGDSSDPGMARRAFGLDLGYIDSRFFEAGKFWVGRTANPFWSPSRVQTMYDADLAFEGMSFKWDPKSGVFATLAGYMISENYSANNDSVDSGLVGGEVGYRTKGENWALTARVGNHHFLNVEDKSITRMDKSATRDSKSQPFLTYRGNTVYINNPAAAAAAQKTLFSEGFVLVNSGVEWKQTVGAFDYTVYGEWIQNVEASHKNMAIEIGGILKRGWISFGVAHVQKEADSVVGAFTDTDTNGGGTDNRGQRFTLNAQLAKNYMINVNHFMADRGIDTTLRDFSSTHFDFMATF